MAGFHDSVQDTALNMAIPPTEKPEMDEIEKAPQLCDELPPDRDEHHNDEEGKRIVLSRPRCSQLLLGACGRAGVLKCVRLSCLCAAENSASDCE
jgi:hypothetical protein